jgi:integrase
MKARRSKPASKPLEIADGNVSVRIVPEKNVVNGSTYERFNLIYFEGNERIRRRFSELDAAKAEANLIVTKLANRESEVLKLSPADRAIYTQSLDLLRDLQAKLRAPEATPLNYAVKEYAEARRLLPACVSLKQVVDDYLVRHNQVREEKLVPDAVNEFIAAKEQAGRGDLHLRDLRCRLTRFGTAFSLPVAQLTGPMLQTYLDGLDMAARSKLNTFKHIRTLIRWCVRRKYAPRDLLDELDGIEKPEAKPSPTLVFTPAELREILAATLAVRPDLVPAMVICAFCGLRTAEVLRLDWREVRFEQGLVEVTAAKAKTATRRVVPLCDAARAWLAPYVRSEGPVSPVSGENRLHDAVVAALRECRTARKVKTPFQWKRNGLRHAFCSYRLSVTQDLNRVALEAGNSPAMIHAHYKELVSPADAQTWFNTLPPKEAASSKVVPLPAIAA